MMAKWNKGIGQIKDVRARKRAFRQRMKELRAQVSPEDRSQIEATLQRRLFLSPEWARADLVGLTISFGTEWDTRGIIARAWEEGKKVASPVTISKTRQLDFRVFSSFDELVAGYAGILEPNHDSCPLVAPQDIDLLIVPGLAFDEEGYRMGFGGGYYDRFLEHFHQDEIALAAEFQIVPRVPCDSHDAQVKCILTEKRRIHLF